jgi:hypothetical protein
MIAAILIVAILASVVILVAAMIFFIGRIGRGRIGRRCGLGDGRRLGCGDWLGDTAPNDRRGRP